MFELMSTFARIKTFRFGLMIHPAVSPKSWYILFRPVDVHSPCLMCGTVQATPRLQLSVCCSSRQNFNCWLSKERDIVFYFRALLFKADSSPVNHLLLHSEFSWQVWSHCFPLGWQSYFLHQWYSLCMFLTSPLSEEKSIYVKFATYTILWSLQCERNAGTFLGKTSVQDHSCRNPTIHIPNPDSYP